MIPLFITPDEFKVGDLIFLSSEYKAYKVIEIIDNDFLLQEFIKSNENRSINTGVNEGLMFVNRNWFSSIKFSVARKRELK